MILSGASPSTCSTKITATTVIVEAGFVSSPADRKKLCTPKGQEEIAEAIANGITAYLMEV
ncbi:N-acetylmuramoyl-L-alanine amidase [Paenibacillus rhizoplanae]